MRLENGIYSLPPGKLATVVTHLEMRAAHPLRPVPTPAGCDLVHVQDPGTEWYRGVMTRVGEPWLWWSRRAMSDDDLREIIGDPSVDIWTLRRDDEDLAILELRMAEQRECELSYFGLAGALIGTGAGRFLMNHAVETAWSRPIRLFRVQTGTFDSPQALAFYQRSGFQPVRQEVEIVDDPRLTGVLPREAAPNRPCFEG